VYVMVNKRPLSLHEHVVRPVDHDLGDARKGPSGRQTARASDVSVSRSATVPPSASSVLQRPINARRTRLDGRLQSAVRSFVFKTNADKNWDYRDYWAPGHAA
jgi:hypothetical protein